jgi:hypothetical protein
MQDTHSSPLEALMCEYLEEGAMNPSSNSTSYCTTPANDDATINQDAATCTTPPGGSWAAWALGTPLDQFTFPSHTILYPPPAVNAEERARLQQDLAADHAEVLRILRRQFAMAHEYVQLHKQLSAPECSLPHDQPDALPRHTKFTRPRIPTPLKLGDVAFTATHAATLRSAWVDGQSPRALEDACQPAAAGTPTLELSSPTCREAFHLRTGLTPLEAGSFPW